MFDYQEYRNRYSQHILFYEAGVDNREKVHNAKVAVIGLGSIGIEAARLLAIAQVKLVRFIRWQATSQTSAPPARNDDQQTQDCLPRGLAGVRELRTVNPAVVLEVRDAQGAAGLEELIRDVDLVLYEDRNSETGKLVSQICNKLNKPWIYAQAQGGSGMTVNIIPGKSACIDCVKKQVGTWQDGGLSYLPTVTDLIARTMSQVQAMEALRILGNSPNISDEAFCFDLDKFGYTVALSRDKACSCCAD
jgi:molybdopterin/thiamine biosynthesis adenylyltransferase